MLAVKVEYENKQAIVGTAADEPVPTDELLEALEAIGYSGEIEKQ